MDWSKLGALIIWWLANFAVFLILAVVIWIMLKAFGDWGILIAAGILTSASGLRELNPTKRLDR